MSHRRRGGPTGHAKKSQSSPDILVEETVIGTTEESDSSETLVDETDSVDSVFHTSFTLDNNTEARQTQLRRSQGRKISNEEEIKKLTFHLDRINNKKIRFLSHKEFLEKCFRDKLTPNGLKINLEPTIGNQNEEFVNQWYKIQDDCAKQLMKMTIKFCKTTIKETEHEIKEIDSKLQSNLPSTEYSNIKGQVSKNQEVTIQQIRRKKTRKYRQLKYGEQISEKQTRNSSVKSSQPNQEQKSSNNNQYNTKRTYVAALKSNQPTKQQNQIETKNQQHDEIINNHNQHARNTSCTRSNINTINRREEQPKNLKHASIQQNGGGKSDQILAKLIHEMQQVTMATENLKNASIKC